jgi:hypothetical protein
MTLRVKCARELDQLSICRVSERTTGSLSRLDQWRTMNRTRRNAPVALQDIGLSLCCYQTASIKLRLT